MIAVADILERVSLVMQDEDFIRWTKSEWIAWINDAAKEIAVIRPAVSATHQTLTLVEGVVQTLPTGSQLLIDLTRNLPNGRGIGLVDRSRLEEVASYWYSMPSSNRIRHFSYDDRAPMTLYVYPPAKAGTQVEALISMVPTDVTDENDNVPLGAEYTGPIVSYCLYRAHSKDSEYANGALAVAHLQAFGQSMGVSNAAKISNSPKGVAP